MSNFNNDIMVSVCISTYNHEDFIKDALNSVLEQECRFEYEVILSNDASTDYTHDVIVNYIANHPKADKIRYYNQEKNLGINDNLIFTLEQVKGKYVALLEGDDYWLDMQKLQKQFDFMEENPEYTLCTGGYKAVTLDNELVKRQLDDEVAGKTYDFETGEHFMPNYLNMFFRKDVLEVDELKSFTYSGDNVIFLMCLYEGKIYFFNEIFAFRRTHPNSAWTARNEIDRKMMGLEQLTGLYRFKKFRKKVRSSLFHAILDILGYGEGGVQHLSKALLLVRTPKEFLYFLKVIGSVFLHKLR